MEHGKLCCGACSDMALLLKCSFVKEVSFMKKRKEERKKERKEKERILQIDPTIIGYPLL